MNFIKGDFIKHPKMDWGIGRVEGTDKKIITVLFEKVGHKKLSLEYVTPILVDKTSINYSFDDDKINISTKVYTKSFIDIYDDIKSVYKNHLVIIENGCYYEVLQEDAEYISDIYGYKIWEQSTDVYKTGFPIASKQIWDDLEMDAKPYIIVSQLKTQSGKNINRIVSKQYPERII